MDTIINLPLVSIVIPTYKRAKLIGEAVHNCLQQTYPHKEIIVVDDNGLKSQDQLLTEIAVQKSIGKNKYVHYHALDKNHGACFARNYGVNLAKGKLLAFYDDDDRWHDEKLTKQVSLINSKEDAVLVACSYNRIGKNRKDYVQINLPTSNQYDYFLRNLNLNFGMQLSLYRKSAFIACGMLDNSFPSAQDLDLNIRLLKQGNGYFSDEALVNIDTSADNRISTNLKNKIRGYQKILDKYLNQIPLQGMKFLHHRILYTSFSIREKETFIESFTWLKDNGFSTFKYEIMRKSIDFTLAKKIINRYMGYN